MLFTSQIQSDCIEPLHQRIRKINQMRDRYASTMEAGTFRDISGLIEVLKGQLLKIYVADDFTKGFQEKCAEKMVDLCRKKDDKKDFGKLEEAKKEGREALNAQMEIYFVIRDFILPELRAMKARFAVLSRFLSHQAIPQELHEEADTLPDLLKEVHNYVYKPPKDPLNEARMKAWFSRDLKSTATEQDLDFEDQLWKRAIVAAIPEGARGHDDEIEILIGCHILNENARKLATE